MIIFSIIIALFLKEGLEITSSASYNIVEVIKMQRETKNSFKEINNKKFSIVEDIVKKPSSMPFCHYHNNYEFYYLRSGRRYYFIKDKTYLITAGTIVFINNYVIHSTEAYENEGYERILITFTDEYIGDLLSLLGQEEVFSLFNEGEGVIKLSSDKASLCEGLISSMLIEYNKNNNADTPFLKTALLSLLMIMREEKNLTASPAETPAEPLATPHKVISEIIGYINNNFAEDITLESISAKFYLSTFYFSRTFKRVAGLGFAEYLNNVRIKEARRLIRGSDMRITDIATKVGYKSSTHFGRVFQKIVGLSPTEYRKRK